jgi:hypothetical protein
VKGGLYRILPQNKGYELRLRVAIQEVGSNFFINRRQGGDENGTELAMSETLDESSTWDLNFVDGQTDTVVF